MDKVPVSQSTEIIRLYPQTWPLLQDDCPETVDGKQVHFLLSKLSPHKQHKSRTNDLFSRVLPPDISSDHLFFGVEIKGLWEKTGDPRSRVSTGEQASGIDPSLPVDGETGRETQESQVSRILESCLEFQKADVAPSPMVSTCLLLSPQEPFPYPHLLLEMLWLLMLKALSRSPSCLHPSIHIKYDNVICLLGRGADALPHWFGCSDTFFKEKNPKNMSSRKTHAHIVKQILVSRGSRLFVCRSVVTHEWVNNLFITKLHVAEQLLAIIFWLLSASLLFPV